MEANFSNNTKLHRFELELDKSTAIIEYRLEGNTITMTHTEVPKELNGKGVGSIIAEKALDYATIHGLKVVASCPFVAHYISKNPKFQGLLK